MSIIPNGLHLQFKDLHDNDWIGVIVNNIDPTFSGRCQIRVYRLMDNLAPEDLPWAVPINSTVFAGDGAGSISIPKIGSIVRIQFNNGDIYSPEYTTIQNIDTQLIEKIKEDYEGTHVLLYDPDEELTIIYQRSTGLQFFHKGSFIQIHEDSMITIQHDNQESMIQLIGDKLNIVTKNEINVSGLRRVNVTADQTVVNGKQATLVGPGPYYHAVLAEFLFPLLKTLATAIDAKMPVTPGVNYALVQQAETAATSTNVMISK